MAISFPSALDSFTNPSASDRTSSPSHATQHSNANDAIEALEAKVGVDSSAVTTSLDYKVSHVAIASVTGLQTALDAKAPLASPTFTGTVTLPVALTGVIRADSGVVSVDSDVTDLVSAASTSAAGKVQLATTAEVDTGTDANKAVTPDALAGSDIGEKGFSLTVFESTANTSVGDGIVGFVVPSTLNGMNIVDCVASVYTPGTTNTTDVQIRRYRAGASADVLSTKLTIDSTEYSSTTAAISFVINAANDDVATGDVIFIDVDAVHTTPAVGLFVAVVARKP